MQMKKEATVARDVEAREIPSGTPITLRAGDPVIITQSLGGSYTVVTPVGFLARIDGKDADAIGEPVATVDAAAQEGKTTGGAGLGPAPDLLRPRDPGQHRGPRPRLRAGADAGRGRRKQGRRASSR